MPDLWCDFLKEEIFLLFQISSEVFVDCLNVVMSQLDKYNSECMVAHRQRLVWKLSNRTLRHLRPTDKLRATLPTISEAGHGTTKRVR